MAGDRIGDERTMTATAPHVPTTERPWWKLHLVTMLVLVLGLTISGGLAVATSAVHRANEKRLIRQRVSESALILTSAVPSISGILGTAAELAEASDADAAQITEVMATSVGSQPGQQFTSLSVWRADGTGGPLVVVGAQPHAGGSGRGSLRSFVARSAAAKEPGLHVRDLLASEPAGIGYAVTSVRPDHRYVVYAESALPADRTQRQQPGEAFEDVDYAVFLGTEVDRDKLLLASTDEVPLTGNRARQRIAFGDTHLLMAMSSHHELGGRLLARLAVIILAVGILATVAFAQFAERLMRRREQAQALASENDRLYRDQRGVAETLQRSLLPSSLPDLPDISFGARYEPGVSGIEIGGDWYDVVEVDDDRLLLVVGDVSGRGLGAGAVMASLRFAIRAHATQGDGPGAILQKLGSVIHVTRDRHFATILCVEVRRSDRTLRIANAGHPRPLLVTDGAAEFLETFVGPPVGVDAAHRYAESEAAASAGATLLMFTDGLFERRGTPIDASLERVRSIAVGLRGELEALLSGVVAQMVEGKAADDTALLGARWS